MTTFNVEIIGDFIRLGSGLIRLREIDLIQLDTEEDVRTTLPRARIRVWVRGQDKALTGTGWIPREDAEEIYEDIITAFRSVRSQHLEPPTAQSDIEDIVV